MLLITFVGCAVNDAEACTLGATHGETFYIPAESLPHPNAKCNTKYLRTSWWCRNTGFNAGALLLSRSSQITSLCASV